MESGPEIHGAMAPEEADSLIHELRVHQVELEMQNEELRRTQAELEESRARYADLYDFAPVGYLTIDAHGLILEANLTAARQLGLERGYLIDKIFHLSLAQPDRETFKEHLQAVFKTRERQTCEVRLAAKSGGQFYARLESIFIEGADGAGRCRTSVIDVTLTKRAEEDRRQLEQRLQQAQKAESLGRMAGAIAHHFNNILGAVMGNLELALDDLPRESDTRARFIEAMKASHRAAEISRLMLAYLGQTSEEKGALDLAEATKEAIPILSEFLPKHVHLETILPSRGSIILADAAHIKQILSNLVSNAVEAVGDQESDITIAILVVSASEIQGLRFFPSDWEPKATNYACLSVSDAGCGLDAETQERIFDPFFSTKSTGRGLGLPVVLGLVRAHEGAVTVETQVGRGATFRVFFPLTEQEALPVRKAEKFVSGALEGEGLVLLAEDEPIVRNITQAMLERLGYEVITAADGAVAVEIFRVRQDEFRLAILDLTMPRMNGWETLSMLRSLRPDIPVVLVSGYDEARVMQGDHAERPQAFVHKPYLLADLKAALRVALGVPNFGGKGDK